MAVAQVQSEHEGDGGRNDKYNDGYAGDMIHDEGRRLSTALAILEVRGLWGEIHGDGLLVR